MLYQHLEEGFNKFVDPITQELAEVPVYFADHPFIFEQNTAKQLFDDVEQNRQDYLLLQGVEQQYTQTLRANLGLRIEEADEYQIANAVRARPQALVAAESRLRQAITNNPRIKTLLENLAHQFLGNQTVEQVLAGDNALLIEILRTAGMFEEEEDGNKPTVEQRWIVLTAMFGQALDSLKKQLNIIDPSKRQARCPHTREVISEEDIQSAKLFRNVFLIAVREAIKSQPAEFQGKPKTELYQSELAKLTAVEIAEAEGVLKALQTGKSVRLAPWQIKQLSKWGIWVDRSFLAQVNILENNSKKIREFLWHLPSYKPKKALFWETLMVALEAEEYLERCSQADLSFDPKLLARIKQYIADCITTVQPKVPMLAPFWELGADRRMGTYKFLRELYLEYRIKEKSERYPHVNFSKEIYKKFKLEEFLELSLISKEDIARTIAGSKDIFEEIEKLCVLFKQTQQLMDWQIKEFQEHFLIPFSDLARRRQYHIAEVEKIYQPDIAKVWRRYGNAPGWLEQYRRDRNRIYVQITDKLYYIQGAPLHTGNYHPLTIIEPKPAPEQAPAEPRGPEQTLEQAVTELQSRFEIAYRFARDNDVFAEWIAAKGLPGRPLCFEARGTVIADQNSYLQEYAPKKKAKSVFWANIVEAIEELLNKYYIQYINKQFPADEQFEKISDLPEELATTYAVVKFILDTFDGMPLGDGSQIGKQTVVEYLTKVMGFDAYDEEEGQLQQGCYKYFKEHRFHKISDLSERRVAIQRAIDGNVNINDDKVRKAYKDRLTAEKRKTIEQIAKARFVAHNFGEISSLQARKEAVNAAKCQIANLNIIDEYERDQYTDLLNKEIDHVDLCIKNAKARFDKQQFNSKQNLRTRIKAVSEELEFIIAEGEWVNFEPKDARFYYVELLEKEKKYLETEIAAQDRLEAHHFEKMENIMTRLQAVSIAIANIDKENILNKEEYSCYRKLLVKKAAQYRFESHAFDDKDPDLETRLNAVISAVSSAAILVHNPDELELYQQLLFARKEQIERFIKMAEERFDNHSFKAQKDLRVRLQGVVRAIECIDFADLPDYQGWEPEAFKYYRLLLVKQKSDLESAIQSAQILFEACVFDNVTELEVRRETVAKAIVAVPTLGIDNVDIEDYYHILLKEKQDSLDLLITFPAAKAHFDKLDFSNEDDIDAMELAIDNVVKSIGTDIVIVNPFEEQNYRHLLAKEKQLIGSVRTIVQYILEAEAFLGQTENQFRIIKQVRDALPKENWPLAMREKIIDSNRKAEEALMKNYELGRNCSALVREEERANTILFSKQDNREVQMKQVVADAQHKLTVLTNDKEIIMQLLLQAGEELVEAHNIVVEPLAIQLQGLQQQLSGPPLNGDGAVGNPLGQGIGALILNGFNNFHLQSVGVINDGNLRIAGGNVDFVNLRITGNLQRE